jgi:hypothetical protein
MPSEQFLINSAELSIELALVELKLIEKINSAKTPTIKKQKPASFI